MRPDDPLFSEADLYNVMEQQKQQLLKEIDGYETNYILNTSVDDLCDYLEKKYHLEAPALKVDLVYVDQGETNVDISQDHNRMVFNRSRPLYIKGTAVRFSIPFDGDANLLRFKPSTFNYSPPRGNVERQEIHLTYARTDHDADGLRKEFDRDLENLQDFLGWVAKDTVPFNASIKPTARDRIGKRREKLLKDQGMVAALGFPMKRRADAPQTYSVPVAKRSLPIQRPVATVAPFKPEPALEMKEYEQILKTISDMVLVIERSPKAFSKLKEEELRHHFLVPLNAQYEGQATGETFNFEGKTDILIRVEGRNIFIAEFKFWRGAASLIKTVDQLLGYASWRDTKTAIVLFNRNKELSTVLAQIPETIAGHPNFKRQVEYANETGFRFMMHHRDDKNRELVLTVLVFEVPK